MKIISKLSGKIQIRIFTLPYMYLFHSKDNVAFGCLGGYDCGDCRLVDPRPAKRWNVGAILRNNNRAIIMDFGRMAFNRIKQINRERGGTPLHYDLKIDIENKIVDVEEISYLQNNLDTNVLRNVKFDLAKEFRSLPHFNSLDMPQDFLLENQAHKVYDHESDYTKFFNQFDIYEVNYK